MKYIFLAMNFKLHTLLSAVHPLKLIISLPVYLISLNSYAQTQRDIKEKLCVKDMVYLDSSIMTIPYTHLANNIAIVDDTVFFLDKIEPHSYKIYMHQIGNFDNKIPNSRVLNIPSEITQIDTRHLLYKVAVTKSYILLFFQNFYLCFNRQDYSFIGITHLDLDYIHYYVYQDYIIAANTYNTSKHPLNKRCYISKYLLFQEKPVRTIYPTLDVIELSHFMPNNWFTCNERFCLLSQANTYQIMLYNHDLEPVSHVNREFSQWNKINIDSIRDKRIMDADEILKQLTNLDRNSISKMEGIWLTHDNHLFVRYYLNTEKDKSPMCAIRYFDIYRINESLLSFHLIDSNLIDGGLQLKMSDTLSPCNSYLLSWVESFSVVNDFLCIVKPSYTRATFGKTYSDVFSENKTLMKKRAPHTSIWLYSLPKK